MASLTQQRNQTLDDLSRSSNCIAGESLARGLGGSVVRCRVGVAANKGGALARQAGQFCNFWTFQQFVASRIGSPPAGVPSLQHAAQFVRDYCGISSRAELDHNARAAALFYEGVRKPFQAWMERRDV